MLQNKFPKIIKNRTDAIIVVSEENRRYLTGFPSTDGFLVITKDDAVFFTDSRYIEAATEKITACCCELLERFTENITPYLKKLGVTTVYTESDRLTVTMHKNLKKMLPGITVKASEKVDYAIDCMREVKDESETEHIIKAQCIAEDAFTYILGFIKPGVTEREIGLKLDYYMLEHGAEALSFETIAVTGKKTSMPHGVPDESVVKYGDFITMDYGAVFDGYHSDMTRTVAVGSASDEQRKIYETVLTAQKCTLDVLSAGVSCFEADKAARDVIENAGYGAFFGHGTGHGVGIEIHEKPNLSPRSKAVLKAGNIVTAEPGIYLPGKFGVRIEDMALITETGYENLTKAPKELIIL